MYTIHCPSVRGRAARAREHKSSLFSDDGSGGRRGEERSAELHPLPEGGAPTFIKLVSLFNIHVKVQPHICAPD